MDHPRIVRDSRSCLMPAESVSELVLCLNSPFKGLFCSRPPSIFLCQTDLCPGQPQAHSGATILPQPPEQKRTGLTGIPPSGKNGRKVLFSSNIYLKTSLKNLSLCLRCSWGAVFQRCSSSCPEILLISVFSESDRPGLWSHLDSITHFHRSSARIPQPTARGFMVCEL